MHKNPLYDTFGLLTIARYSANGEAVFDLNEKNSFRLFYFKNQQQIKAQ
jgi:hypothetical protein